MCFLCKTALLLQWPPQAFSFKQFELTLMEMAIPSEPQGVLVLSKLSQAYSHWTTPSKEYPNLKLNLATYLMIFLILFSFFSNVTGLAACLICPERFFCEGAEGDSKTPIPCPKGHYCPVGTGKSPEKCPAGRYNPQVSFINSLWDFINGSTNEVLASCWHHYVYKKDCQYWANYFNWLPFLSRFTVPTYITILRIRCKP